MPTYQPSLTCLETLIGLSQNNCACNTSGRPATYNTSLSGLFMDDYEHGIPYVFPNSAKDCGDNNVWDVLQKARYEGINDFITYLFLGLGKNLNHHVNGFAGEFGEVNKRTNNTPDTGVTKALAGHTVIPHVYKGASIKFKKVWLAISLAGDYDIEIYDLKDLTTPVRTATITHPGNYVHAGVNITGDPLPLSEAGKPIIYAVAYNRGAGVPLNYTYYCGCGENYKPSWMKAKYMESYGFNIDAMNELYINAPGCNRTFTGGLITEWELICDPADWICKQDETFWKSTPWGRVAAKAALLMSTVKSISAVLDSGKINYYTLVQADRLEEKRTKFLTIIDELIGYLGETMPEQAGHCWHCVPAQGFKKQLIRA